jgi:hypothetical protein
MATEKLSLFAIPSKAEKHSPAQQSEGLSDPDCEMALDRWQAHIGRLRILVDQSGDVTPNAFLKCLEILTPELRRAATAVIICDQILNGEKGGI